MAEVGEEISIIDVDRKVMVKTANAIIQYHSNG